ncbi:nickel import ATP-binding protein NikE [Klebsiella pneumoniae]|nr:nickel import ATP-binding protein NikE [Klebsiella pneumoniae]
MNLLSVAGVSHDYPHHGRVLHEIQLAIAPGETVALLGRSGCGKSTPARMLVGLETPQHGDIARRGTPLTALKGEAIGAFRRDIQLVFQDAFSAVNPRKTVREIVSEPLRHLLCLSREARARRVEEMLLAVDLAPSLLDKRPAQLSGGQLQRVCPARALAVRPQLLILDEAVSNLDLLMQAEIIALLKRLQAQFDTACLFITHDLRLVERFCQRVLVMEHGRIVETATVSLPLRLCSPAGQALQQAVLPLFLPLCLTRPCHAARNPDP